MDIIKNILFNAIGIVGVSVIVFYLLLILAIVAVKHFNNLKLFAEYIQYRKIFKRMREELNQSVIIHDGDYRIFTYDFTYFDMNKKMEVIEKGLKKLKEELNN